MICYLEKISGIHNGAYEDAPIVEKLIGHSKFNLTRISITGLTIIK